MTISDIHNKEFYTKSEVEAKSIVSPNVYTAKVYPGVVTIKKDTVDNVVVSWTNDVGSHTNVGYNVYYAAENFKIGDWVYKMTEKQYNFLVSVYQGLMSGKLKGTERTTREFNTVMTDIALNKDEHNRLYYTYNQRHILNVIRDKYGPR